jgi:putative transposase
MLDGPRCPRRGRWLRPEPPPLSGAARGQVSDTRLTRRNGYRHRDLATRNGTADIAVSKLGSRTHFPEWLLEHCQQAAATTAPVVATCQLLGPAPVADKLVLHVALRGFVAPRARSGGSGPSVLVVCQARLGLR